LCDTDTSDTYVSQLLIPSQTATAAAARHSRHEQLTPPETTPPAGEAVPGSAAKDAAAADAAAANVSADTSAAVTNTTNAQATAGQTEAYNAGAGQTQTGTYNADTSQMTYTTDPTTVGDTAPTRTTKEHGFVDKVKAAVTGHTTHTAGHTTTHPTGQNHPTQYTPTALTA
jgi:hypothetical protein